VDDDDDNDYVLTSSWFSHTVTFW